VAYTFKEAINKEDAPDLDYMFILISNESFQRFYNNQKVFVQKSETESGCGQVRGPAPISPSEEQLKGMFGSP